MFKEFLFLFFLSFVYSYAYTCKNILIKRIYIVFNNGNKGVLGFFYGGISRLFLHELEHFDQMHLLIGIYMYKKCIQVYWNK